MLRKEDERSSAAAARTSRTWPRGCARVTFVRSLLAHARLDGIDTTAAEAIPGVRVLTGDDVDCRRSGRCRFPASTTRMGRPVVAKDVVRFVGEIVAIVVSDDRATGADAAELVMVDYDPLPAVVDPQEAAEGRGAALPGAWDERRRADAAGRSTTRRLFDGCDVIVSDTLVSQRLAPCPLEPRSAAARSARTAGSRCGSRRRRRTRTKMASPVLGMEP